MKRSVRILEMAEILKQLKRRRKKYLAIFSFKSIFQPQIKADLFRSCKMPIAEEITRNA